MRRVATVLLLLASVAFAATPDELVASSWLARRALQEKRYADAERYAADTYDKAVALLGSRPLDSDAKLPTALGAAIEVRAQAAAARGERDQAVVYLREQLARFQKTSIATRIQKNINLLSLEGKPAPALEGVGPLAGRATLLFFWAHWCGDCKAEAPIIERLRTEMPKLRIIAPTQTYGYAEGGREVPPAEERAYIERVRQQFYPGLAGPVSGVNFRRYGASTTPTLVLVDSRGIVRVYHPGNMTYEELRKAGAAVAAPAPHAGNKSVHYCFGYGFVVEFVLHPHRNRILPRRGIDGQVIVERWGVGEAAGRLDQGPFASV